MQCNDHGDDDDESEFYGNISQLKWSKSPKININIDGCDKRLTVTSLDFDDGVKDSCLGFGSLLVQSSWPNDFWTNIFLVKKTLKVGKSVYLGPGFSIYQTFYPCRSVSAPLKFDI